MTTATGLRSLDHSLETTICWIKELQESLDLADQQQAYSILRAVMHTLRDRLSVNEAAEFAAQLPMVLQGLYYHEWNPSATPEKIRSKADFLIRIREKLTEDYAMEEIVRAVFCLIKNKISEGEIEDVKANLPSEIKQLWE